MKIDIHESYQEFDTTQTYLLRIPQSEYIYVGYILEGFEGMCNYSTIKKSRTKYMKVNVSPDFVEELNDILGFLKYWNWCE